MSRGDRLEYGSELIIYVTVIESVDFQIFLDNKNNLFVMKLELKMLHFYKILFEDYYLEMSNHSYLMLLWKSGTVV